MEQSNEATAEVAAQLKDLDARRAEFARTHSGEEYVDTARGPMKRAQIVNAFDKEELRIIAASVAGNDARTKMEKIKHHGTPQDKETHAREYVEMYPQATADIMERLERLARELMDKKTVELDADDYTDYERMRAAGYTGGLRSIEAAKRKRYSAMLMETRRFCYSAAAEMGKYNAALLTADEKREVVDRWAFESDFDKAREEFREKLKNTKGVRARAELMARYPEFM